MFPVLLYWLFCLLIPLFCFSVACLFYYWFDETAEEGKFLLAISLSLLFFAALYLIKVAGVSIVVIRMLGFTAILSGGYCFYQRKLWENINRHLLILFTLALLVKYVFVLFWHHPAQGADWMEFIFVRPYLLDYYGISSKIKNNFYPFYLINRTPLYYLITAGLHQLLNSNLYQVWVSQIVSILLNSLLLIPVFYIARFYWSQKTANWLVVLLSFNPFLFYQTIYSWPKNFVVFFVLAGYYWLFISKHPYRSWWGGLFLGLAYVAHYYAIFYIKDMPGNPML